MQALTTKEIIDRNLATLESNLAQTSPLADKAFLRVLAAMEGLNHTELYKFGAFMTLQNLALTASETYLELLGQEIGVERKSAESAVLTIQVPAEEGTVINATVDFIGILNGLRYYHDTNVGEAGGYVALSVTSEESGVIGNLNIGDNLNISTPVPGAQSIGTVTAIENVGAEKEDLEVFRERVLFRMRATNGGSNAVDYTVWAEGVAGVKKAYAYAGKPPGTGTSYPGDRTVFIETDIDIDPDGIPDAGFLAEIKAAIQIDPDTEQARACLGLTDSTLYVEPIIRTAFDVEITGLNVSGEYETQAKADITTGLDEYFRGVRPFVEGVDRATDRNDTITNVTVSNVIQDILTPYGASAEEIEIQVDSTVYTTYTLDPGETAKAGTISYAV